MNLLKSYQTLKRYRKDPLLFISQLYREQGHRAHLKIFGKNLFVISHPDYVIQVLKTKHQLYTKGRTTKELRKFLGSGLVTNEGDSWRKQHRLIRPIMNMKSIIEMSPRIHSTVEEFLYSIDSEKEVNVFEEMNRLTWRITLKTLFSQEPSQVMDDWLKDIRVLMRIITAKTRSSIPLPYWIPTAGHRRMKHIIAMFDEHVYSLIDKRRKGTRENDLLQLLIDAQETRSAKMTDLEIRDEIMTFMMAGHETITNSMTWNLIEYARNPEYKKPLEEETRKFQSDTSYEKLNAGPWFTAFIDEVLRLHPPIWVFMRQAELPDQIGNMRIPRKSNVVLAPYNTHRADDLWERSNDFYPERFMGDERKKIVPGAFYPFGLGPRACIGAFFAGIEAKIIMTSLISHFDWEIISPEEQLCEAGISLRPINNVVMKFRRKIEG